jgi:hypothetical protein
VRTVSNFENISVRRDDALAGNATDDPCTRRDLMTGALIGSGIAHCTDEAHLRDLFSDLEILFLEHKVSDVLVPAEDYRFPHFNFVARRSAAPTAG